MVKSLRDMQRVAALGARGVLALMDMMVHGPTWYKGTGICIEDKGAPYYAQGIREPHFMQHVLM